MFALSGSQRLSLGAMHVLACLVGQAHGYTVLVSEARSPDEDFVFMSHARVFVEGGGGYSNMVHEMVLRLGGQVVRPREICTRPG